MSFDWFGQRMLEAVHRIVDWPARKTSGRIVGVAALMARIDGQADPAERAALLIFLRQHELLERSDWPALLRAYDLAVSRPHHTIPEDWSEMTDELLGLVRTPDAMLAATAAANVAVADGMVWPREMALLRAICDRLCLDASAAQSAEPVGEREATEAVPSMLRPPYRVRL
jgi:tellurite resistance protein